MCYAIRCYDETVGCYHIVTSLYFVSSPTEIRRLKVWDASRSLPTQEAIHYC